MGTGAPDSPQVRYAVVQETSLWLFCYIPSFFKIFLFTLYIHTSIRCFQYPRPSSPRICTTPRRCDVNITWLIEPMKIKPSVNSSIADNRSMNCWPVNRTVLQRNISVTCNSPIVVYLLYCFYTGKKKYELVQCCHCLSL